MAITNGTLDDNKLTLTHGAGYNKTIYFGLGTDDFINLAGTSNLAIEVRNHKTQEVVATWNEGSELTVGTQNDSQGIARSGKIDIALTQAQVEAIPVLDSTLDEFDIYEWLVVWRYPQDQYASPGGGELVVNAAS